MRLTYQSVIADTLPHSSVAYNPVGQRQKDWFGIALRRIVDDPVVQRRGFVPLIYVRSLSLAHLATLKNSTQIIFIG